MQQPVLLVGLVALMASLPVIALSLDGGGGGGGAASPPDTDAYAPSAEDLIVGSWRGTLTRRSGAESEVALEIRWTGHETVGALTRVAAGQRCRGALRHEATAEQSVTFDYRGRGPCPRRSTIVLGVLDDDRLRIDELRGGRLVAQGELTAR
jgi:hypothetical protein